MLTGKEVHVYKVKCEKVLNLSFFLGTGRTLTEIIIFCFVVAICDVVQDVETIFHLSYVLTPSGNLF